MPCASNVAPRFCKGRLQSTGQGAATATAVGAAQVHELQRALSERSAAAAEALATAQAQRGADAAQHTRQLRSLQQRLYEAEATAVADAATRERMKAGLAANEALVAQLRGSVCEAQAQVRNTVLAATS